MKILKLLNKKFILFFIYIFFILIKAHSNEPVDIWNIEKKDAENLNVNNKDNSKNNNKISVSDGVDLGTNIEISEEKDFISKTNYLVGLYDPAENDLSINMWEFTDGEKILRIIDKIQNLKLSEDAKKLYNNLILTNALPPKINFSNDQFLKIKIDWLIKNNNLNLIKNFIIKNGETNIDSRLLKFYLDQYLSVGDIENACNLFSFLNNKKLDDYISKYKIYCLINNKKKEVAQLQFDLLKEQGFNDKFFEGKFNFLMGYDEKKKC